MNQSTRPEGQERDLPPLTRELINLIGMYGHARADRCSEAEILHRWGLVLDGIKEYARAALAVLQPQPAVANLEGAGHVPILATISAELTRMFGSAKARTDADGWAEAYVINTGAIHHIVGLLQQHHYPVTIPAVMPEDAPGAEVALAAQPQQPVAPAEAPAPMVMLTPNEAKKAWDSVALIDPPVLLWAARMEAIALAFAAKNGAAVKGEQ
jgi:hypothetical protein